MPSTRMMADNDDYTWTRIATGTYHYVFFSRNENGPDVISGYDLYVRDDNPQMYKIENWLNNWTSGTAFVFKWNRSTNACEVIEQATGYDHPSYGTLYIIEGENYYPGYSDHTSYYDPDTKTFHFFPLYCTEDGFFGQYEELFEITEINIDISSTAFPDENFRNYLLSQPYGADGVLTSEEISGITVLDISNKGIRSLKGIEFFDHLEALYCYNNQLSASEMDKLISFLPTVESGVLRVLSSDDDANVFSFPHVEKAKQKGWTSYRFDGSNWIEIVPEYHDGDAFVAKTAEGVDMTFVIINAEERTVMVGDGQTPAINRQTGGTITIPSTVIGFQVTDISEWAFAECANITSVNIGNSVKSLGLGTFYRCSSLEHVTIGESVEYIGAWAFESCVNLWYIVIPNSVQTIGESAFSYCTNLVQVLIGDGVKSIGDFAFQGCQSLCYLDLGNSVEEIGRQAFCYCSYLGYDWYETGWDMTLKFPNSLKIIGPHAFADCNYLSVVNLPQSLESVDGTSFMYSPLETITVAEGNPVYDSRDNCNAVIHTANNELIIGCNNSTIPNTVTSIGSAAFLSCKAMTSIILPNSLTNIGDGAFSGCSGLTEINIPNSVTNIEADAFRGCSSLTRLSIPASVTTIGQSAFSGCPFESITVNEDNTVFDSRDNCNAIVQTAEDKLIAGFQNTIIPNTIKKIDDYAFYSCHGLTSLNIPNSVTSIGKAAFKYCNALTSVTLPESLTGIEEDAFFGCSALEEIKSFIIEPFAVNEKTFQDEKWNEESYSYDYVVTSATLYVPAGTKALYEATEGWNQFQNIVEMGGEEMTIPDEAIDLGLPSGTKWAPWNVGASKPEDYGGYYAWGETDEKEVYDWGTYIHCDGSSETCHDIGSDITGTQYDVAHVKWSGPWQMPTLDQIKELVNNCTSEYITINGINGRKFTGPNGNSIFLPAAGCWDDELCNAGSYGYYWSSTLKESSPYSANIFFFGSGDASYGSRYRSNGHTVRPVIASSGEETLALNYAFDDENLTASVIALNDGEYEGDIVIPETVQHDGTTYRVTSIGDRAFDDCDELTLVTIPEGVLTIGEDAFSYCTGLESLAIPASVTSIGDRAFSCCYGLNSITVASDNQYYDSRDNCNALIETSTNTLITGCKNTVIPNTVESIGFDAFNHCYGLISITIPESVTSIGEGAFDHCGLTAVTIPAGVTTIGEATFQNCDNLASVTFSEGLQSIGREAFKRTGLTSINLPEGLQSIGEGAFDDCDQLSSVSIPSTVTSIDPGAFYGCANLTKVTSMIEAPSAIDESVFSIGWDEHDECIFTSATLYVPAGTKALYEATESWNKFQNIVELEGDGIKVARADGVSMKDSIFDLSGQRVQSSVLKPQSKKKGIYIRNGKKVVVK